MVGTAVASSLAEDMGTCCQEWCQRSSFLPERRKTTREEEAKEEGRRKKEGKKENLGKTWTKQFGAACALAGPPKR